MKTIFLVDDDADDRELFQSALNTLDFQSNLIEASNGKEALAVMSKSDFPLPAIIFTDLNMPIMGGKELLVAIKKQFRYRDIPLYIYTTSKAEKEKEECLSLGADGFMTKHFSFVELCGDLKNLLQHHLIV